jgi:hypothetical protein
VSRAEELAVLAAKYASVANREARAAMVQYAVNVYGCDPELARRGVFVGARGRSDVVPADEEVEHLVACAAAGWGHATEVGDGSGRRPEHARLLRHIDELNPTLRRIA